MQPEVAPAIMFCNEHIRLASTLVAGISIPAAWMGLFPRCAPKHLPLANALL